MLVGGGGGVAGPFGESWSVDDAVEARNVVLISRITSLGRANQITLRTRSRDSNIAILDRDFQPRRDNEL